MRWLPSTFARIKSICAAEIAKAQSRLAYAEAQLGRTAYLARSDTASQQALDHATNDAAAARADVDEAKANHAAAVAGPTKEERFIADAQVKAAAAALAVAWEWPAPRISVIVAHQFWSDWRQTGLATGAISPALMTLTWLQAGPRALPNAQAGGVALTERCQRDHEMDGGEYECTAVGFPLVHDIGSWGCDACLGADGGAWHWAGKQRCAKRRIHSGVADPGRGIKNAAAGVVAGLSAVGA
jgi:hypothetical protein